jgi:hypothetical protein
MSVDFSVKRDCLLINGESVDPWLVGVNLENHCSVQLTIELRLDGEGVLHELNECDVDIGMDQMESFIKDDLKKFPENALAGYLDFARYFINPPPPQKYSWIRWVFNRPPKRPRPTPIWNWCKVDEVKLTTDGLLLFKGQCCRK